MFCINALSRSFLSSISNMNFVVKASASFGLLLLLISNNPTQAFQLTGFNLYENDNFTAPKQYIDFTDPDDYHKIRLEYSLSNGETFKSMSLTLREVEVFLFTPDQELPICEYNLFFEFGNGIELKHFQ